jgi:hypothetical protein
MGIDMGNVFAGFVPTAMKLENDDSERRYRDEKTLEMKSSREAMNEAGKAISDSMAMLNRGANLGLPKKRPAPLQPAAVPEQAAMVPEQSAAAPEQTQTALDAQPVKPAETSEAPLKMSSSLGTSGTTSMPSIPPVLPAEPAPSKAGSLPTLSSKPPAELTPNTSETQPRPAVSPAPTVQPAKPTATPRQPLSDLAVSEVETNAYLRQQKPKVVASFIKAGKPELAKQYLDFVNSEEGNRYAGDWLAGMKATEAGDYDAAIPHFTRLYNRNVPDGRIVSIASNNDGTYNATHIDSSTGEPIAQKTLNAGDLAAMAATSLSPEGRIKMLLDQATETRKRNFEMTKMGEQEDARDFRAEKRDDRRDDRQAKQIDAALERQDNQLNRSGKPSLSQERGNEEIRAARERISKMDPAEIQRRSQKATNTGRENPDYDPSIARAASLAGRRMVGEDQVFDSRQPIQAPKTEPVQSRFSTDPAMKGMKMGKLTPSGFEVLDSSGKLLGHYH